MPTQHSSIHHPGRRCGVIATGRVRRGLSPSSIAQSPAPSASIHNKADWNSSCQSVRFRIVRVYLGSVYAGYYVVALPPPPSSSVVPPSESMGHPSYYLSRYAQSRYWQFSSRTARQQDHWHRLWAAVPFILMSCQAQPPQPVAVCSSLSSIRVQSTMWNVTLFRPFPWPPGRCLPHQSFWPSFSPLLLLAETCLESI